MNELKVALTQMNSTDNWDKNILQATRLIEKSFQLGKPEVICFPENSLYMRMDKKEKIKSVPLEDKYFDGFKKIATQNNCHIYFGSVPLLIQNKTHNATVWIDNKGKISSPYQKIHLFDVDVTGGESVRESADYSSGSKPAVIDVNGWRWGLSICYDLRFSELYSKYHSQNVDVISIPSAFLVKTGEAHWHTLVRARAIESQAYVIASAQGGEHIGAATRKTYGHSLAVDPWGRVMEDIEESPGVRLVVLKKEEIAKVRAQIPMGSHRKL